MLNFQLIFFNLVLVNKEDVERETAEGRNFWQRRQEQRGTSFGPSRTGESGIKSLYSRLADSLLCLLTYLCYIDCMLVIKHCEFKIPDLKILCTVTSLSTEVVSL